MILLSNLKIKILFRNMNNLINKLNIFNYYIIVKDFLFKNIYMEFMVQRKIKYVLTNNLAFKNSNIKRTELFFNKNLLHIILK